MYKAGFRNIFRKATAIEMNKEKSRNYKDKPLHVEIVARSDSNLLDNGRTDECRCSLFKTFSWLAFVSLCVFCFEFAKELGHSPPSIEFF